MEERHNDVVKDSWFSMLIRIILFLGQGDEALIA